MEKQQRALQTREVRRNYYNLTGSWQQANTQAARYAKREQN